MGRFPGFRLTAFPSLPRCKHPVAYFKEKLPGYSGATAQDFHLIPFYAFQGTHPARYGAFIYLQYSEKEERKQV